MTGSKTWRIERLFDPARYVIGDGSASGPLLLHRRRVYILPTRAGYGFAGLLLLLLLGSINYGNSLGFVLTFLLGGVAWVGMHHTYRNLVRLRVDGNQPRAVFAGGPAVFPITLACPDDGRRHALRLQAEDGEERLVDIEQHGSVLLERATGRRGWQPLGRFTVATRYPLGLFRCWAKVDLGLRCLVYPRPAPPGTEPPPSPGPADRHGERGRGDDDFTGFRGYQVGDAPREIYWKGFARSDQLLSKQFGGEWVDELWLEWEALTERGTEARLSRLCRWLIDAELSGRGYGLRLPDVELAPARGEVHLESCLAKLALFGLRDPG